MTNTERSTYPSPTNAYGSSGRAQAADAPGDDLASIGAAAFREAQASVESVIADAGDYAGKKGSRKPWTICAELATHSPLPLKNQSRRDPTYSIVAVIEV